MGPVLPLVRSLLPPRSVFCLLAVVLVVFGPSSLTRPWLARAATHVPATAKSSNMTSAVDPLSRDRLPVLLASPFQHLRVQDSVKPRSLAAAVADVHTSTTVNGAAVTVSMTSSGDNAYLTFSGATGEHLGVGVTGVTIGSGTCSVTVRVLKPDGTNLSTLADCFGPSGGEMDVATLPVNGTYTLFVDPQGTNTGSATLTLSDDVADATNPGGLSPTLALSRVGQNGRVTFSGAAGEHLGVGVTGVTIGSGTCSVTVRVLKPDGTNLSTLADCFGPSGGEMDVATLPVNGTYTLLVDPQGTTTGSATLTVSDDLATQIVAGGAAQTIALNRVGQNGRATFLGASGQNLSLSMSAVTIGSGICSVTARVLKPDGTNLSVQADCFGPSGGSANIATLPVDGTYIIFVDPQGTSTGSATLTLRRRTPFQPPTQTYGTCSGLGVHALAPSNCLADPVNSLTGAYTTSVTDLTLPGPGVAFAFTRSYTSADTSLGRLGPGWTDAYGAFLTVQPNGDVLLHGEDGQRVYYARDSDGSFVGAGGARSTLTSVSGGYELLRHDLVKYAFNNQGRLSSVVDRNGQGVTLSYDGAGRLTSITDAAGRTISFSSNADGTLNSITAPGNQSVAFGYTGGRLTSVTDLAGKTTSYTYDAAGRLLTEVDPNSHTVVTNAYDPTTGRVTQQTDALGKVTTFAWDAATQTATATDARNNIWKDVYSNNVLQKRIDALNNQTQFGHDTDLNTSSVIGPSNATTTLTYDSKGNLTHAVAPASLNADKTLAYDSQNNVTSVTDARGKVTSYGYDANGNNTTVTQDGVTVATYTYNASGQMTSYKDGRNNTTTYTYDANGNLESETDALGNKTSYTYDAGGRMLSRVDPRGNVQGANPDDFKTTYTYDGAGRMLTETDPLGHVTTYAYDASGNRTTVTDANTKTTTYAYDAANRVTSITAPDTGVTSYTYDTVGNKLTETNPNNKTTTYSYDADNRLASVTTPLGNKTTYSYDGNGNLTKQVEPRGNVQGANPDDYATTYTYDAAGRLLTETDPLGNATTYAYDKVGNKTSVTDANTHTTSYAYNGRNLMTSVSVPGGAVTGYTYDAAGNVTNRTEPNDHATTYVYDAANRLSSMTLPLNRQWNYAYDAAGNRTQVVDANGNSTQTAGDGTTTYGYDRAGRLTSIDYSDSTPDVTFAYDNAGNRTQMTDGAGTRTYSYDSVNRLTQVTRGTDTFAYTYDLMGNITRRTYPDSTVLDYTYDNDSRMATLVSGVNTTSYAYDAAGNLTQTTLPSGNGYTEERTYDRAGRLTRVKSVNGATSLVDLSYTLDPVGNPTQVVRTGTAPGTTTYGYDARDRLTEVCRLAACPGASDPFIRWTYDAAGNRLTEARPSGTTTYTYDAADELTSAGSTTYTYDQNGNQITAGTRTFSYDLANRLISTTSGSVTTTYTYDGEGNRLQTSTGSQASNKTNYLWDSSGLLAQLALERDGSNNLIRRYEYGVKREAMTSGGNTFYYHDDGLGSVANVTSSSGATEWTYEYDPFGATSVETQVDPVAPENVMKFAGELADATGLIYLRAREYDPVTGRLLERDPLPAEMDSSAVSTYAYVGDRPTVFTDPSGMTYEAGDEGVGAALDVVSPVDASDVPLDGPMVRCRPPYLSCAAKKAWNGIKAGGRATVNAGRVVVKITVRGGKAFVRVIVAGKEIVVQVSKAAAQRAAQILRTVVQEAQNVYKLAGPRLIACGEAAATVVRELKGYVPWYAVAATALRACLQAAGVRIPR